MSATLDTSVIHQRNSKFISFLCSLCVTEPVAESLSLTHSLRSLTSLITSILMIISNSTSRREDDDERRTRSICPPPFANARFFLFPFQIRDVRKIVDYAAAAAAARRARRPASSTWKENKKYTHTPRSLGLMASDIKQNRASKQTNDAFIIAVLVACMQASIKASKQAGRRAKMRTRQFNTVKHDREHFRQAKVTMRHRIALVHTYIHTYIQFI